MKYTYYAVILTAIVAVSCNKDLGLDVPKSVETTVTLANAMRFDNASGCYVVKKDETVFFDFSGPKVDDILFFSGEIGHEYRYRNRTELTKDDEVSVKITSRTAVLNPKADGLCSFQLLCAKDLSSVTSAAVEKAEWEVLDSDLRDGAISTADVTSTIDAQTIMPEYLSANSVVYAVRAKSDEAEANRLRLREFNVVSTETRDYGYELDGVKVEKKGTRQTTLIKACTLFDDSYRAANDMTAACWASYTPAYTTPEGLGEEIPNSQYYVWNVAEIGLRYGEGSGYPIVKTNAVGQNIRCTYDLDVYEPTLPITLPDGRVLDTPSHPLKMQPSESWLVSRTHSPRQVARDELSNMIKNKAMGMVSSFSYSFQESGKFTATFHLDNQNISQTNEKVVEFNIIVVE